MMRSLYKLAAALLCTTALAGCNQVQGEPANNTAEAVPGKADMEVPNGVEYPVDNALDADLGSELNADSGPPGDPFIPATPGPTPSDSGPPGEPFITGTPPPPPPPPPKN
jgi:hypothetical protein